MPPPEPKAIAIVGRLSLAAARDIGLFVFTPLLRMMLRDHAVEMQAPGLPRPPGVQQDRASLPRA
jgi:hypothetical protein